MLAECIRFQVTRDMWGDASTAKLPTSRRFTASRHPSSKRGGLILGFLNQDLGFLIRGNSTSDLDPDDVSPFHVPFYPDSSRVPYTLTGALSPRYISSPRTGSYPTWLPHPHRLLHWTARRSLLGRGSSFWSNLWPYTPLPLFLILLC